MNKSFYDEVTIIITRHYENRFLIQLLKYYQIYDFPFKIIILDSSEKPIDIFQELGLNNHSQIQYEVFNKSINMFKKILLGLEKITTPYSVICSDDDFITLDGIIESVDFLENNKDYSVVHGNYFVFETKMDSTSNLGFEINSIQVYNSIEDESPTDRFFKHFTKYEIPTYSAVHRTDFLNFILKETIKYSDDYRFGELLPSLLTLIKGKMKKIDVFYAVRRFNNSSSGQTLANIDLYIKENSYKNKYKKFRKCLADHLSTESNIKYNEAEKIVDSAMSCYLHKSFGGSVGYIRLKFLIKDIVRIFNISQNVITRLNELQKKIRFQKNNFEHQINTNNNTQVYNNYNFPGSQELDLIKKIVLDGSNNC